MVWYACPGDDDPCKSTTCENGSIPVEQCGGKSDWYLSSEAEFTQLYGQRNAVGGFEANWYWSSTQADAGSAKQVNFADGTSGNEGKANSYRVRAIRSF